MYKKPTNLELGLADFLQGKTTEFTAQLLECDDELIHEQVEIAMVPGYNIHSLDGLWIEKLNNQRLGAQLLPGEPLRNFFKMINIHPAEVLVAEDLRMEVAESDSDQRNCYMNMDYRHHVNGVNAKVVEGYLDLLTNFKVDASRPPMCTPEMARTIMDNATYGGFPLITGYMRISDVMALNFNEKITFGGKYMIGIHDNVNGSGYIDSADCGEFSMWVSPRELLVCRTKGYSPDTVYGVVNSYLQLDLSNKPVKVAA